MNTYEQSLAVMTELFARDRTFALATAKDNIPSVRIVDTFYDGGAFYIVTYAKSQKAREIEANANVALSDQNCRFSGKARNIGHPLAEENRAIREILIKVFEPWYFAHNNEEDEHMCYVKVELDRGFFYKDGTGYKVDFPQKTAESFPFDFDPAAIV